MKPRYASWYMVATLLCWCLAIALPYLNTEPLRFLRYDPFIQFLGVKSLVEDGDLNIMNQVEFNPGNLYGQSALGARGEWYPLHETPLIFLGVPFYAVFGVMGLWFLNIIMSIGTAYAMYSIAKRYTVDSFAMMVCTIIFLTTPLSAFSHSFSVDTLAVAGITGTFLFTTTNRPFMAGLLLGVSIWGRLANVAFLPAFMIYAIAHYGLGGTRFRFLQRFILGMAPGLMAFAALNLHMFGGVFETAYHHNQFLVDGELKVLSQTDLWSVGILDGITNILFNPQLGLVFSWPLFIPALVLGVEGYYKKAPRECLLALGLMASIILFYAPYAGAIDLGGGPRHFLVVHALCTCFCIFSLHRFLPPVARQG